MGDDYRAALADAFRTTPLHDLLDLRFARADADLVVVEMPVAAGALNPTGNLHGGAIATLVDVASGVAAAMNSRFTPGENTIVTADLHVRYLGRPNGDRVRAEAHVLRSGRQLVVVECRVLDDDDRVIAVADFSSMVVPLRQPLAAAGDIAQPDI
jgi:uncharacterized protein (TIGR00369 family)